MGEVLLCMYNGITWFEEILGIQWRTTHMPCPLELSLVGMCVCTCVCVCVCVCDSTTDICSHAGFYRRGRWKVSWHRGGRKQNRGAISWGSWKWAEALGICPRVLLCSYPLSTHCTPGSLHGAGDLRWAEARTSLVVQWLRLCAPNVGDPSSNPGQGARSHMSQLRARMLQLEILHATIKTRCHQMT